ncbi:MAG: sigma-70 family RNA polymerase sigma factor [Actinobacteria bacterium]|nr:sigma-70 family RNA polymerase sigma factor [Actinomycetota bacterium]
MTPLLAPRPRSDRAFERLYKRHVGDVYRYALAVMRNPADAEDVTQTTFLNAYRSYVEKGSRPEKPQHWLIAIAHNVCRQRFRQSSRRPAEVSFEDDIADSIGEDDTPTGDDIRRALSHLAFNQRAALVMRELEGRSYAEIADILEVSTSAVETLIFRARRALREQLEGSITCGEAEFAISRQLDGRLPRQERGQLRGHLRECAECAGFARRQRAQRGALKTLALVPVPSSLMSLFGGGGGAAVGTGLALKAAAALTAGLAIGGAGYEGVRHAPWHGQQPSAAAPAKATPIAAASAAGLAPKQGPRYVPPARPSKPTEKAAPAQAKKAQKLKTHGLGSQKVHYRGDAGVAARHVKTGHASRPTPPARRPTPLRTKPKQSPKEKPKPHLPAGPFDVEPPTGQGGGNGHGNGK